MSETLRLVQEKYPDKSIIKGQTYDLYDGIVFFYENSPQLYEFKDYTGVLKVKEDPYSMGPFIGSFKMDETPCYIIDGLLGPYVKNKIENLPEDTRKSFKQSFEMCKIYYDILKQSLFGEVLEDPSTRIRNNTNQVMAWNKNTPVINITNHNSRFQVLINPSSLRFAGNKIFLTPDMEYDVMERIIFAFGESMCYQNKRILNGK